MRLKSLEMQGFKSFADRTVINFDHGVTIVVGPNGSGKSNISDAIRWVLGEMSSKNIRGSKMEDVIFGGTNARQPMSFAEVSLCFDNSDPESRIASDYSEITVTRRYHRSGESEYMINRKAVRLKDITELFLNTGIGKNGYSIISQGNIANVLSQKSEDRRTIFEEAAGISKYRYKKNEAERNLSATDENLIRLTDINNELASRVGPLEAESKKAQIYLEIYEEKKIADIAVWTYEIENIKSKFDEIDLKYTLAKNDYEDSQLELDALEKKSEESFNSSQECKLQNEKTLNKITELTSRIHSVESEIKVLQNDISYINLQTEQTKAEIDSKELQKISLQEELAKEKTQLVEKTNQYNVYLEAQQSNDDEIKSLQESSDNTDIEISGLNEKITAISDDIVNKKLLLSTIEGSHSNDDARLAEINNSINEQKSALLKITEKCDDSNASVENYRKSVSATEAQIAQYQEQKAENNDTLAQIRQAIYDNNISIDTKTHRIENLMRMEELLEGYSNSVRVVMKAASSGDISGVCGPVSKLINVDKKYITAIETALGANIQNIVVENENSAKSAINYLKLNNAGRATFYPLTSISATPFNTSEKELSAFSGFVGIASHLLQFDSKYTPVIEYLLGKTVVFDNIDNASFVAKKYGYKFRIATLDGQIINAGGSFTGGSVKRDSGILSRNSEIDELKAEIKSLDLQAKELQDKLQKINSEATEIEDNIHELEEKTELTKVLLNAENTQYSVYKNESDNICRQLEALNAEALKLGSDRENSENECNRILSEISLCEKTLKETEDNLVKAQNKKAAITSSLSSAYEKNNELILSVSESRNVLANATKDIEEKERQYTVTVQTIIELSQALSETENKLNNTSDKITQNTQIFTAFTAEMKECEKLRAELSGKTEQLEKIITELRTRIKDCTHKREALFQSYTKLEAQRQNVLGEQDNLSAKLWDEYEMTFSAAKEFDRSGVCADNIKQFANKQTELKSKLKRLGSVNVNAIEEYKEVRERYDFLSKQIADLTKSKEDLLNVISQLEKEMQVKFTETFTAINTNFKSVFKELFGGGHGELILCDPENPLTSGVEINVAPPGKIINNINLLSGGEKSFVAIALFFAILKVTPSPFCILDEIESALDEVNVSRFADYSKVYSQNTQFIIITHRRGTMESADTLYGVTMKERGISTVLSIDVKTAEEKMDLN